MAKKGQQRRRKRSTIIGLVVIALVAFCVLSTIEEKYDADFGMPKVPPISIDWIEMFTLFLDGDTINVPAASPDAFDELSVHFIDVGQAKAILIKTPTQTALIDAGENGQGELVLTYLRRQGVERIDYLIGTHPHADHIGGMDEVIKRIDIGMIIMPEMQEALVPTTKTYTDVLLAIAQKGYKMTAAKPGATYKLGDALLTILSPVAQYDDLNNISIASRLDFGEVSFLFTGDIENTAENDIIAAGARLEADVLDIPHHGSNTSSTKNFIAAVNPSAAVFSCGIDNSYGHPHRDVVERYAEQGVKTYRTDLQGTIVISTNGEELNFAAEK